MAFDIHLNRFRRVDLFVTILLLIVGALMMYNGPILTAIGYAGGFRILAKFGLFISIIGAVLTASFVLDPQLRFKSSLVASGVILGVALPSLALLPREPVLTSVEFALVYYSSVLAIPVASAEASERPAVKYWLLLAYAIAVILACIFALRRDPRGPIGLYLLMNTILSTGVAGLLYLTIRRLISCSPGETMEET